MASHQMRTVEQAGQIFSLAIAFSPAKGGDRDPRPGAGERIEAQT